MIANIEALEKHKIGKLIADYSVPAIIGMLVMASYNIVDRIFVGRGVGTTAISAIAITFPINIVIMGFAQLVGMGSTALVSIKLGEKKKEEAERIIENGFLMALCISVSLAVLIFLTMDPLVTLLGGTGEAHRYATQFLSIVILGIPLQFIAFSLNGIIRAQGSPRIALVTILISGILNIILNPVCIMVLHLGIRGSAIATVISQCVGAVWVIIYFTGRWSYLKLRRISFDRQVISRITMIGVSPLIMQVAGSLIMFVFNKTLYSYGGNLAIAAMGIGMSLMMVVMMPIYGLNQGIQPIIGFNYGAKHIDRVMETLRKGIVLATTVCVAGFLAVMLFSTDIVALFNAEDKQFIALGGRALKIAVLMLPLNGFQVVSWAYFQAVGKPKQAMILTTTKQMLFVIPLVVLLPRFFALDGVWIAMPIADFLAACLAAVLLIVEVRRLRELKISLRAGLNEGEASTISP
ncbi:MAG: MATE family efflux transporter [Ignavibacteriales bacterium]|nr:MATE family efflux transporter [Ignavibacteriales bacterium]